VTTLLGNLTAKNAKGAKKIQEKPGRAAPKTTKTGNAAILAASGAGRQDGGVPRQNAIGLNRY